jgi:hypothetical protein
MKGAGRHAPGAGGDKLAETPWDWRMPSAAFRSSIPW